MIIQSLWYTDNNIRITFVLIVIIYNFLIQIRQRLCNTHKQNILSQYWSFLGIQRHPEAAQRLAGGRETLQALRHEEVPTECEQRAEAPVPRASEAGNTGRVTNWQTERQTDSYF